MAYLITFSRLVAGIAARMPNITSGPAGNECRQHDPQPHDKRAGPLGQQKAEQVLPDRDLHRAAHQGRHALNRARQRAQTEARTAVGEIHAVQKRQHSQQADAERR